MVNVFTRNIKPVAMGAALLGLAAVSLPQDASARVVNDQIWANGKLVGVCRDGNVGCYNKALNDAAKVLGANEIGIAVRGNNNTLNSGWVKSGGRFKFGGADAAGSLVEYGKGKADKITITKYDAMPAKKILGQKSAVATTKKAYTITKDDIVAQLKKEQAEREKGLVGVIKGEFDYNGDGYVDNLRVTRSSQGGYFVNITEGNTNIQETVALDRCRYEVLKAFRFADGEYEKGKLPSAYVMASGNGGRKVVEFMVDTNKYATETKMDVENGFDPLNQTKFADAIAVTAFTDKVANSSVRGDFIGKKLVERLNSGEFKWATNNPDERWVYGNSFGDDVTVGQMSFNWTLGSAIYNTIQSDFLPTIGPDAVLSQTRGANFNTYVVKINGASNPDMLNAKALDAYVGFKEMYEKQIEATKLSADNRRRF